MSETYARIAVVFRHLTGAAVQCSAASGGDPFWIPRSLIHGADDATLDARFDGDAMTIRIFAWKARELGL